MTDNIQNGEGVEACPLCGGRSVIESLRPVENITLWIGICTRCYARSGTSVSEADALTVWNTRHTIVREPATADVGRITREQYPEIIQATRWMDEDHGTPHFEPGVGFIVDDPDGLTVPIRWVPHLPTIEAALAGLDHEKPHPLDVDTLEWLAREGKEPTLYESAAHCFVSGEHTPMTAMAESSEALWIASRFFNERFEGWEFDPAAGYTAPSSEPAIAEGERFRAALKTIAAFSTDAFPGCCQQYAERALAQSSTPPASKGVEDVRSAAQFLSDRLDSLEWMDNDLEATLRDYMGHVDPAHARLRFALAASPTPSNNTLQGRGEVERLREALAAEDEYWAASRILAAAFARIRPQAQAAFDAASMRRQLARAALQKDTRHDG